MMRFFRPTVYYVTSEICPKTNNKGEAIFCEVEPTAAARRKITLMHPDNLPAFLTMCLDNNIDAIDQREIWKAQQQAWERMNALEDSEVRDDTR